VRKICDRYGVLLVSDEVICAFGRLGTWFGGQKYDYVPDVITCAKGMTAGYAPLGAMIVSDRIADVFMQEDRAFLHGFTWAGHPTSCAVALKVLDVLETESVISNVASNQDYFRSRLESLYELPIVGDVRGTGYFYGVELVKDQATKESFNAEQSEALLRGYLSPKLYERGLICRSDDRGDPVVQLAPPLIIGRSEIDEIVDILHTVLSGASHLL
jgi:adenosylmethionine-8-amino-7-oxononanoate aminotransferase